MKARQLTKSDFVKSWTCVQGVHSLEEIAEWVEARKHEIKVDIRKIPLKRCNGWSYHEDEGVIRNEKGTFFKVTGLRGTTPEGIAVQQPIIIQDEIGYLGFLVCFFDGVLHFLVQSKIEPGNLNSVQLSPTIQATRSNFTRQHHGNAPAYLEWFLDADPRDVVVDRLLSEQASRFLGKRNRNIIVMAEGEVPTSPNHRWMTLGQIAHFLTMDNYVNMDTRTVLSCIPYMSMDDGGGHVPSWMIANEDGDERYVALRRVLNDYRMMHDMHRRFVSLVDLDEWTFGPMSFNCKHAHPFQVVFCDIEIEGREVRHWCQPLFEACGSATFGLIARKRGQGMEFLIRLTPEIGSRDLVEFGPTVQVEAFSSKDDDPLAKFFFRSLEGESSSVFVDVMQSEEGGRFYHEQNRNIVVMLDDGVLADMPNCDDAYWCDFPTLSRLCVDEQLNIQLRSLVSLLGLAVEQW